MFFIRVLIGPGGVLQTLVANAQAVVASGPFERTLCRGIRSLHYVHFEVGLRKEISSGIPVVIDFYAVARIRHDFAVNGNSYSLIETLLLDFVVGPTV